MIYIYLYSYYTTIFIPMGTTEFRSSIRAKLFHRFTHIVVDRVNVTRNGRRRKVDVVFLASLEGAIYKYVVMPSADGNHSAESCLVERINLAPSAGHVTPGYVKSVKLDAARVCAHCNRDNLFTSDSYWSCIVDGRLVIVTCPQLTAWSAKTAIHLCWTDCDTRRDEKSCCFQNLVKMD